MSDKWGWEALICDYFYQICINELGPYFTTQGFISRRDDINGVFFRRNEIFVEVSYIPESSPNYSPTLVVGKTDSSSEDIKLQNAAPAWFIMNGNDEYSLWCFKDEKEFASVLNKLRLEIIEPILKPLWENNAELENALKNFDEYSPE